MSDGGGYYEPGRGQGQRVHQGAAGQPEQVRGRAQPRGRQGRQDRGRAEVTEVIKIEVTASEVTAPKEETKEDPMTKDDLEEEEEDAGEQGILMGTSGEPTKTTHIEMLIIWATTMGIPVLYQYSSLNLHHHYTS